MRGRSRSILIYVVVASMTVALLLSTNSGNRFLVLLPYIFLPIGLVMPELLIPTYFISSLSSNFFEAAQGIGFTRLIALAFIAGVLLKFLRRRKMIMTKWVANLAFIAFATLLSFWFSYVSDISQLYSMGLSIFVFIAMTNLSLKKDQLIQLFSAILLAVLITSFYYLVSFSINPDILANGRLTISDDVNENRFAMMLAQLAAYSLAYMFITKRTSVKIICLFAGVLNVYFLMLSGSRSALIGIALGFVFTALISAYVQKKIKQRVLVIIISCIAVVTLFYIVIESNPILAYRMNLESLITSQGTGRWPRIMGELQYIIPNHPLFGVGPGSVNETISLTPYLTNPGSSHNFVISALTQVGFIGFVAYMSFYLKIIKNTVSKLGTHALLTVPLMLIFTAVFNGIGEVIYSERLFWNTLSLAVLCLATYSNESIFNAINISKNRLQKS